MFINPEAFEHPMAKLRIIYTKERCIGQGSCAAVAPQHFLVEGGKSQLIGATKKDDQGRYHRDVQCNESQAETVIQAGLSCPVNAIQVINLESGEELVRSEVTDQQAEEVVAEYDDAREFVLDQAGYFLIRLNPEKKCIEVAFCNDKNNIVLKVSGKMPLAIYHTILNKKQLPIRKDHAAYLGRELQKAFLALQYHLTYVQDDELILP